MKIKAHLNNKVPFMQDMSFWEGLPDNVVFDAEVFLDYDTLSDLRLQLTAFGYGKISVPFQKEAYGNGKIFLHVKHLLPGDQERIIAKLREENELKEIL